MIYSPYIDSEVGHARRHAYDAWNRMVEIQFNNGNTVWTLEFDGLNRLIEREKISGTENPTYDHYYNRDWQMLETRKDDTLHWQHAWSQRYIDAPVLWDRDTDDDGQFEKRYYFATDANMNVTALIDDTGVPKERYTYDAYGNPRMRFADYSEQGNNQSNFDNHWLFAGYFKLPQDAYHVRNRMYHPTLGAWMQRDPLGYVDGGSLYAGYFASRGLVDPSGQLAITVPAVAISIGSKAAAVVSTIMTLKSIIELSGELNSALPMNDGDRGQDFHIVHKMRDVSGSLGIARRRWRDFGPRYDTTLQPTRYDLVFTVEIIEDDPFFNDHIIKKEFTESYSAGEVDKAIADSSEKGNLPAGGAVSVGFRMRSNGGNASVTVFLNEKALNNKAEDPNCTVEIDVGASLEVRPRRVDTRDTFGKMIRDANGAADVEVQPMTWARFKIRLKDE